ncbi:hypothetical protein MKW92_026130 [Papaver armeniacum]|nr:hypothetical protein MKW92_026130 [Papaver armeniacum]
MGEITSSSDGSVTNSSSSSSPPPQGLLERLKDYGQEDVFHSGMNFPFKIKIFLFNLDLPRVDRIIRCSLRSQACTETSVSSVDVRTLEERERWWKMGLKAISEGKLAVLLLAGGQVYIPDPKGCFNIDSVRKSLFQLQAERILCSGGFVAIHWYIMTSPMTDDATRKFFESHKYFGLEVDQVTFFQQGTIPCVSKDGRFIMESPSKVAKSPDGNGGVYSALKTSRLLEDMAMRGVKYVDCYGVDNALAYPQEKVGVFVRRGKGGSLAVVEYSEMDQSMTSAINQETGRLRYCWSNVCLHMFTLDFLNQVANGLEKDSIENANGTSAVDTPDSARLLVLRLHSRWVVAAGGFLTHSIPLYATGVEISPLCSYAEKTLKQYVVEEHSMHPVKLLSSLNSFIRSWF